MNKQEQLEYFDRFVSRMRHTMLEKGDDYAGKDRLDNFKNAGAITGIGPSLQCLSLIATKVARLGQLLASGKTPKNESVDDSILDLANYSVLLGMVYHDVMIASGKRKIVPIQNQCTACGEQLTLVRPGKYQCDNPKCVSNL